jgi:predicted regulator of Ras-like GTPase activity (Roadblock/LC7/MglB family)
MLPAMDAAQALADLTEISSQVVNVAILEDGEVLATTFEDAGEASRFAEGVARLVAEADRVGEARGLLALAQLEAATLEGSVFVVRRGSRLIAATTRPDPTVGLVFYDLKHCLGSVEAPAAEQPAADASAEAEPGGKPGGAPRRRRTKADASG